MNSHPGTTFARGKSRRLCELDLLRAAAILLIVAVHSGGYTSHLRVPARVFLAELGLSIFLFISGYALAANYGMIQNMEDVRRFLLKRILRIYPLYVPALFIFVALFHYCGVWHQWDITPVIPTMIAHVLSSQILLSPAVTPIDTLWFVGCIALYYLVYVILAYYGRSNARIAATAFVVFLLFAAIKALTGLVEYRFFYYYPVFIGGIFAGRVELLNRSMSKQNRIAGVLGGLVVMSLTAVFLWPVQSEIHSHGNRPILQFAGAEGMCLAFSLAGVVFSVCLVQIVALHLPERIKALMLFISASSYAAYLFHRPILAALAVFCHEAVGLTRYGADLVVIGVGLPIIFVLCNYVQRFSDTLVRRVGTHNEILAIRLSSSVVR